MADELALYAAAFCKPIERFTPEQEQILAALDDSQKVKLVELVGKKFDPGSLGRVSFKAPELSSGDRWINSDALTMEDLRGKVVALHFWAFG